MLRHFYQLQDHLHAGAQRWTYLAVDVAGSTALKSGADPLAIEFTFAEFHRYVAHHAAAPARHLAGPLRQLVGLLGAVGVEAHRGAQLLHRGGRLFEAGRLLLGPLGLRLRSLLG